MAPTEPPRGQTSPSPAANDSPRSNSPSLEHAVTDSSEIYSPLRHHYRTVSSHRKVKETYNARSQYSTSQDDGASQRRINQYLIQQEIGRGSFGAVHLATDQFGKEYAVKEFSKSRLRKRAKSNLLRQRQLRQPMARSNMPGASNPMSPSASSVDQDHSFDLIKEEIAVMKKLNHVNLVSLIEVLDDPEEDSLYMVLEMCKKGVVMKIEMDEDVEPYDDEQCRHWFRDLILGVEYLHAQGVIHRDIKPDNCLLTDDNTLKIVDFGVSEMFEKDDEMKIAKSAGSPAFMAPELCQVKREGIYGKPADIWSMGVTLYCLKFGRVPFRKQAVLDLYESIINDPLEPGPACGDALKDLMLRIFEKDPTKRIQMEDLRAHPWVTKSGIDPLLSKEENCAQPVIPPTEEEKNMAITSNMGRLIAVLKAANRFKTLLQHRNPELMESILHRASRMVQPPLSMTVPRSRTALKNDLKEFWRSAKNRQVPEIAPHEHITSSGIYRASDVHSEVKSITEQLKDHFTQRHNTVDPRMDVAAEPESSHELSQIREEHQREEIQNRRHSFDNAKGHAHDPLEDQLFLNIGQGPTLGAEPDEDTFVVSESPPPTEIPLYEEAYKEEVSKIRKTGRKSMIFLTRRVEGKQRAGDETNNYDARPTAGVSETTSKRARVAEMVGKARQKAEQKAGSAVESAREANREAIRELNEKSKAQETSNIRP